MISVRLDIDLVCPECGEHNLFPSAELVAGGQVGCLHCGAALFISRYRDYPTEPPVWHLESALPDETNSQPG